MNSQKKMYFLKFLFLVFLASNSFVNASNISLNYTNQREIINISKNKTIKELFTDIARQTEYRFFYDANLSELNKLINLSYKNSDINSVLNIILKNSTLEYKIKDKDILIRSVRSDKNKEDKIKEQNIILGFVKDETGLPLGGVNVSVLDTKKGTTTDFDGKFSIEANPGQFIEFSYIGYQTQKIIVGDKKTFEVFMKPAENTLDEIIISGVAAGTSKKKMSVSVTKIKADDISLVPQSSVSAALSGKIAGANIESFSGSPGSGSRITLRGATSLTGNQTPLILVDGVIMQGSLSDINVDDVETIEVVKGAAASALYGSKAGNGVVVITSKRGSKLKKKKLFVTYRTRYEMQRVAKYLELSNSHPYELSPNWLKVDTYTMYNGVHYPIDYVSGWDPRIDGNRVIKSDGYMDLPYRLNNNLQKSMFTSGGSYTNYIAAGYKTNKTNLFVSFEDNKNNGIIIETGGYKRNSFRGNIDYRITDAIKFSASNNLIFTNNNFMGGGTGAFFEVLMMEPDVDLFKKNPDGQKYNYFPNHWNTIVSNPLYDLWRKKSNSEKNRFLGSYKLKWQIKDWLSSEFSYAMESQKYESRKETPSGTFIGMQTDSNTNEISPRISTGYKSKYNSKIFNQNIRATLNFNQSWNELDFKGKLSYLLEDNHFESESTTSDDYLEEIKAVNYFAITSFVYKDRYILDALYRYDGSSLFGENERWQSYYRLSGAYRITKDFPIKGVEELKIRTAYGTSGQRPIFAAQYETFSLNNDILSKNVLGNKNLKPSRSAELELGLDISFLKRFAFEATYSNTITSDQFIKAPLAAPFGGFKFQWANVGTLQSNTFEAALFTKIIKKDKIKWNVNLTFDKTNSKITKLDIPAYSTGPRNAFKIENEGEYGIMYGVDFVKTLSQMEAQLPVGDSISDYSINSDGLVVKTADIGTPAERAFILLDENGNKKNVKIGNINPDFRMGLSSTFTYKNFSFYTLWKWKNGGDIYNGTAQYLVRDFRHSMMDMRFTRPENKKSVQYFQSLYDAQSLNSFWVEDASYVRLNEASIYYTFNPKNTTYFKSLKVGLTGKNLVTFTKYTGYDPEAGYSGFLFDNYGYPNFRNYAFSLELKF